LSAAGVGNGRGARTWASGPGRDLGNLS